MAKLTGTLGWFEQHFEERALLNRHDNDTMRSFDPGVRIPAPVYFFASVFVGFAIGALAPVSLWPALPNQVIGATLVGLSFVLAALAARELLRVGTTLRADRGATQLVTTGPFRYSRNPMYVSLALLQAGIGFWANNVWVLALLIPALFFTHRIIVKEERHLEERFGEAYRAYIRHARRWL